MRTKDDIKRCRDCKHFDPKGLSVVHNNFHQFGGGTTTVCRCKPKVIHGIINTFYYRVSPGKAACGMFEQK